MTIVLQKAIALLPLLIIGLTIIIIMLCIGWKRNHVVSAIIAIFGLAFALLSLYFVVRVGFTNAELLMQVDSYSVFYSALVLLASLIISAFSFNWLSYQSINRDEFYLLLLIATIGGVVLTAANHLASFFLGIELVSLPLFGMIGYTPNQNRSLEATIKYTLLSGVSSSFLLFGIALIYICTGQMSFIGLSKVFSQGILTNHLIFLTGLGMIIASVGFKLSLAPFHLWTPDVYQGAPVSVSAFMATVSKTAVFSALVRFFLYKPTVCSETVRIVLASIACTSMLFGNLMALGQKNIKRLLGCSSITHMGQLSLGLIAIHDTELALEATGIYLIGYIVSTLGVFGIVSLLSESSVCKLYKERDALCSFYVGLFWSRPLISLLLTVLVLSLAGIPATLGFIGKFYLILLGKKQNLDWLTGILIASSVIGLFYYLRIINNLYIPVFSSRSQKMGVCCFKSKATTLTSSIVVLSSLATLVFGLYPNPLIILVRLAKPFTYSF